MKWDFEENLSLVEQQQQQQQIKIDKKTWKKLYLLWHFCKNIYWFKIGGQPFLPFPNLIRIFKNKILKADISWLLDTINSYFQF